MKENRVKWGTEMEHNGKFTKDTVCSSEFDTNVKTSIGKDSSLFR
jgi:hypothetical protein